MPRLRHYDNLGTARFITFSCYRKHPYLLDEGCVLSLLEQMKTIRTEYAVRILGYVIMPDHVHLVLDPPAAVNLGVLIGQMKARIAYAIIPTLHDRLHRPDGHPAIWQRRCYDHNCRSTTVVTEKIIYCHNNPVRRGLVNNPEDWPWSSYRWYKGDRRVPLDIDGIEL